MPATRWRRSDIATPVLRPGIVTHRGNSQNMHTAAGARRRLCRWLIFVNFWRVHRNGSSCGRVVCLIFYSAETCLRLVALSAGGCRVHCRAYCLKATQKIGLMRAGQQLSTRFNCGGSAASGYLFLAILLTALTAFTPRGSGLRRRWKRIDSGQCSRRRRISSTV